MGDHLSIEEEIELIEVRIEHIDLQLDSPSVIARAKGWSMDEAAEWWRRAATARQHLVETMVRLRHAAHVRRLTARDELVEAKREVESLRTKLDELHAQSLWGEMVLRDAPSLAALLSDALGVDVPNAGHLDAAGCAAALEALPSLQSLVSQPNRPRKALRRALGAWEASVRARRKALRFETRCSGGGSRG